MAGIVVAAALAVLTITSAVLLVYALRHTSFALWRLSAAPQSDPSELAGFRLPHLTVFVPMHNEEAVAEDILHALLECDYDWDRLQILAINDASSDGTQAIIDSFRSDFDVIQSVTLAGEPHGKAAALLQAQPYASGDIYLVFDADYLPGRSLLKMLVAPFADPHVGAVMGRVVPHNTGGSILASLLSLERASGYQTVQQSRQDLFGLAQFGGTVGGVRASALAAAGGWKADALTEDTDLTCRLLIGGWRIAYVNRAECYEEVPERWPARERQLERWVMGHTDCLHRYWRGVLSSPFLTRFQKADALLMLGAYWTAPAIVCAWLSTLVLFFGGQETLIAAAPIAALLTGFQLFANQATFLELGTAALLDGSRNRALLLPLTLLNFFASTGAICRALVRFYVRRWQGAGPGGWNKTERSRPAPLFQTGADGGRGGELLVREARGLYRPVRDKRLWVMGRRRGE